MNLVTILEIIEKLNINPHKIKVKPTKNAISMIGTTSELKLNCIYSLYDLFFGMMLPSGNDSAYLIAEIAGFILKL
jgi:D-alanyl-D-alanine carboxypeptidase